MKTNKLFTWKTKCWVRGVQSKKAHVFTSEVASHLGCQEAPEAEHWSGWSARCHGYHPPRDTHPHCSTCKAAGAIKLSVQVYSGGSARCTSTEPLHENTQTHTVKTHRAVVLEENTSRSVCVNKILFQLWVFKKLVSVCLSKENLKPRTAATAGRVEM